MVDVGSGENEEPLRVLIDLDYGSNILKPAVKQALGKYAEDDGKFRSFSKTVKELGGPSLQLEYPPTRGEERENYLTKLRTEIMAGKGPDVFVCMAGPGFVVDLSKLEQGLYQGEWEDAVFQFPQQAMKRNMFLDLSEYIPEFQFTDWEKLTPVVMEAGRYQEGQYILPMSYTTPITLFRKSEAPHTHSEDMTWDDMLAGGPALQAAAVMDSSIYQGCVFQPFTDLERDELAFSEEELLNFVKRKLQVYHELSEDVPDFFTRRLEVGFDVDLDPEKFDSDESFSMIPIYSLQGGYGAMVVSFAAVNANTTQPEAAVFLTDYLLSEACQSSCLYAYATSSLAVPTMEGLMQEGKSGVSFGEGSWRMSQENYETFASLREHIAWAEFCTPLGVELQQLFGDAQDSSQAKTLEELVHGAYMRMQMMVAES